MKRVWVFVFLAIAAASGASPNAAKAGMDPQVLARIPARMKAYVDQGSVAGVVTLVQRHGALAEIDAVGMQDVESGKPMRPDTIFQIMSMTKPVTGVAIMMLAEEGRLRLNDPVEKHLPEFRGQQVIESRTDSTRTLRKPSRPITIRDLMTHTSGLPSGPPPGDGELLTTMDRPLSEAVLLYSQQPLEFEPGSKWLYSNPGIATLGRIVEVAADMPFETFLETRIFQPLGMKDSGIRLPAEKTGRLAQIYQSKDGKLARASGNLLGGDPLKYRKGAKYSGPEFALYSTAEDLALFYQMMLNKGTLNGRRLLSPASVETMTQVHTGDLKAGHELGTGFGLTWEVTKDPLGTLTGQSKGTFGHGGAYGTYGWIDPKRDLVGVFMIQFSGNRKDVRDTFIEIAAASILD